MEHLGLPHVGMIVCLIAMLWARSKASSSRNVWARPVSYVFGFLALGLALSQIWAFKAKPKKDRNKIMAKEEFYRHAAHLRFGQYLAERYPGKSITVLGFQETQYSKKQEEATIAGLTEGLNGKATLKKVARFPGPEGSTGAGGPDDMMMFEEMMITGVQFDEIIQENFDSDVIVSLVPLPMDMSEMEYFRQNVAQAGPQLYLLFSSVYELSNLLAAKRLAGVLCFNPKYRYDLKAPIPESYDTAFEERYLIVDSDNVREMAGAFPQLLAEIKVMDPSMMGPEGMPMPPPEAPPAP